MDYYKRMADIQLEERLNAFGAVLIEGPKWAEKPPLRSSWRAV